MCSVTSCMRSTSGFSRSTSLATSSTAAPVKRNRFQLMTFTPASSLYASLLRASCLGLPIASCDLASLANLLGEQAGGAGGGLQFAPDRLAPLVDRGDHQ